MDDMISEKKDRDDGSSSCSNSLHPDVRFAHVQRVQRLTLCMLVAECALPHVC